MYSFLKFIVSDKLNAIDATSMFLSSLFAYFSLNYEFLSFNLKYLLRLVKSYIAELI